MITKNNTKIKNIDYYLGLPWTYTIENDVDENGKHLFVIRVNELPGVVTDAYTIDEGVRVLKEEVMPVVFVMYRKDGEEIPEPTKEI